MANLGQISFTLNFLCNFTIQWQIRLTNSSIILFKSNGSWKSEDVMLVSAEARTHGPDVHTTRLSRGLHFSRRFKDEKDDETKKLSVNYCTKENIQMSFAVTSFLCWGRIEAVRTVEVVRTIGASRFISWKTFSPPSSINNFDTKLLLNVHNTTTLAFYATFSYAFDQVFICFLICIFTCVLYTLLQLFNSTFSNAFYFT